MYYSRIIPLTFLLFLMACTPDEFTLQITPVEGELITSNQSQQLVSSSVLSDPNRWVWGGSVVKGYDGKYHMLYASWPCGDSIPPFGDSWVLHSEIAYAVSDKPDKDFKFQKVILKGRKHCGSPEAWDAQMVHNPHLKKFKGKYYLYYIGSKDPGQPNKGQPGYTLSKRNRVQQSQQIGLICFKDFEQLMSGDFERPDQPLLSPRTRVKNDKVINPSPEGTKAKPDNLIVVNPSVVYRPTDQKYILYFKGNMYDPHWRGVHGYALADKPEGPFITQEEFVFDIHLEDGKIASAEDPYAWYSYKHKCFFAIIKDFSGKITRDKPGLAFLKSKDGIQWKQQNKGDYMPIQIPLTNGTTLPLAHLERPQLLIDEKGEPEVLYCAAAIESPHKKQNGNTFNIHFSLKK